MRRAGVAGSVPGFATAPAVLFVACVMSRGLAEVDWDDITDAAPAVITAIGMPFTFSISTGIGLGFISYAAIKLLSGRRGDVSPAVIFLAGIFIVKFAISGDGQARHAGQRRERQTRDWAVRNET